MSIIRDLANESGIEVPARGRINRETVIAVLRANPAFTREKAREAGIPVGTRGRMAPEVYEGVANTL